MLTEKILHKIHFSQRISATTWGFFAFASFMIGTLFVILCFIHLSKDIVLQAAATLCAIPYLISFLCFREYKKFKKEAREAFKILLKIFLQYKNGEQTFSSLREQDYILKEMDTLTDKVLSIPERKDINIEKEQVRVWTEMTQLRASWKMTTFDIIYDIAESLKIATHHQAFFNQNISENQKILQNVSKKSIPINFILSNIFVAIFSGIASIYIIAFIGIIFFVILSIIHISRENFMTHFRFEIFPKNLWEFRHIVTNTGKYWQLSQKETENLPILSLLFTDIINLLSKNITERKNFLQNYKKFWKYKTSSLFLISSSKNFPVEVQQFFAEQNEKLIKDANDIRKFIVLWKDLEIKKLAKLHLNAEIPELSLQSKRREILLKNLEKIK